MIEFYINGQNVEVQIEDEETVGDVLKSFEKTCEENEAAVIGIKVDGRDVSAETFDEEAAKRLEKNTRFDFSVVTKTSIQEAFEHLAGLFDSLSEKMEEVPLELQKGHNAEVGESIKKLADNIEEFGHIAALSSLFPETFKEISINGMNFKDFFADFSQILLDFEQALQNNDTVLVGDLSEYELGPRLKAISQALHF